MAARMDGLFLEEPGPSRYRFPGGKTFSDTNLSLYAVHLTQSGS